MAFAEVATINGIKYDLIAKAKIATVIAGETRYSGNIVIPESVEYNGGTYSVISIGNSAFYNCSTLSGIVIPNSVTSIGESAFYGCCNLEDIEIPDNVTSIGECAFYNCSKITSVKIPDGVTRLGQSTFRGCSSLTSVVIGTGLASLLGDGIFEGCEILEDVYISDIVAWCNIDFPSVEYFALPASSNPFYYASNLYLNGELVTELVIPEDVTEIKFNVFYGCKSITSIVIPNSVTSIGADAFEDCSGLTSIEIPNSVTSIGDWAFYGCTGLTSIEIPNSVTSIGADAFRNCSGLTSIEIPNSVTSIGNYAFEGCSSLTSIEIPNSVTSIGADAFSNCSGLTSVVIGNSVTSIGYAAFYGCTGLTSIEISNSVTSIGNYAFRNCSGLTSIEIPNSVTSIGDYAFEGCSGLTSVEIPNSVTNIGHLAFSGCTNLTTMTIGKRVEFVESYAFANCENLTEVYCYATTVPFAKENSFNKSYPEYMTLYVPAEAIDEYKETAPWSNFGTIVALKGDDLEPEVPEEPKVKVCTIPVISYGNGDLLFECETEGAECVVDIKCNDNDRFYGNRINLSVTYSISVYATAVGYENSETVNATLCWVENGDVDNGNNIINVPATAALITSAGGAVTVSCSLAGEVVAVYTTDGVLVGTATIDNDTATIATGLSKGAVVIVKIGEKSVKVVVG